MGTIAVELARLSRRLDELGYELWGLREAGAPAVGPPAGPAAGGPSGPAGAGTPAPPQPGAPAPAFPAAPPAPPSPALAVPFSVDRVRRGAFLLRRTREEVPHSVEVEINEMEERGDGSVVVRARIWAETDSQKGILIGAGGKMIRAVGTAAREEIERATGTRAHLDLNVRVRKGWRRDDGLLDRLGIE